MDRFRPDDDNSIEPSQLTAEEILAEFLADLEQERAAAPRESERSAPPAEPAAEQQEEDVRVYVPRRNAPRQRETAPVREEREERIPEREEDRKEIGTILREKGEALREKIGKEWRPKLDALLTGFGKKETSEAGAERRKNQREQAAPPATRRRAASEKPRRRESAPKPEAQEEEVSLSVADILAEYHSGLFDEPEPEEAALEPEAPVRPEPVREPEPERIREPEPETIPEPEPELRRIGRKEAEAPAPTEGSGLFDRAASWLRSKAESKRQRPEPERQEQEETIPQPPARPEPEAMPAPRPRRQRRDEDQELDVSHMSIDDILAEFKGEQEPEPAPEMSPEPPLRAEKTEKTRPSLFESEPEGEQPENSPAPEPESRPESKLARQALDARRFIAEMEDSDFAGIREEAAYDRPAAHLDWETDPRAGGRAETEEESFDPRFYLGGQRPRKMVYGDQTLDLSPEEGYVPPQAKADSYPAPQEREEAPEEAPGFFQRLLSSRKKIPSFTERKPAEKAPEEPAPAPEERPGEEILSEEPRTEEGPAEQLLTEEDLAEEIRAEEVRADDAAAGETEPEGAAPEAKRPEGEELRESGGFREMETGYAPRREYNVEQVELPPEGDDFPSFGQYLMGLVGSFLARARGYGGKSTASAEADEEDLGPEVSPAEGMKHYSTFIPFLRLRFRIGLVLLAIMTWITLGLPVSGALRSAPVAAAMVLGLQFCVMLLCLDVVTNAILNVTRLRFGADFAAVFACLLTGVDALTVAMGAGSAHMPLCLISSLALMGVLLSSLLSARALRKTLRVPAIGKLKAAVTGEEGLTGGDLTLIKSARSVKGFVRRTEEMPPDEWLFLRLSPVMLILVLLLGLVVCAIKKDFGSILYVWSALLCPAIPVAALLCFALPFFLGSNRNFRFAAAIAGWSGLCDIGKSRNLIVTDRDLFPEGTIKMGLMRILAESRPEQILTYAGSMVAASGIGFGSCFAEEMEHCGCSMRQVENFEFLPGGGLRGIIDSQVVLCGSTELMRLMNVWVPDELVTRTSVLLAVDGILQGIFNLEYSPRDSVRAALVALIRSTRHPIFAIRDFNVTPAMLRECFDLSTDGYDFPPYVDRFALSEASPDPNSKIAAVLCREGLESMIQMADTGRGMYTAVRLNLFLTILGVLLGVLFVFTRLLGAGVMGPGGLLVLALVCALPVFLLSFVMQK